MCKQKEESSIPSKEPQEDNVQLEPEWLWIGPVEMSETKAKAQQLDHSEGIAQESSQTDQTFKARWEQARTVCNKPKKGSEPLNSINAETA